MPAGQTEQIEERKKGKQTVRGRKDRRMRYEYREAIKEVTTERLTDQTQCLSTSLHNT